MDITPQWISDVGFPAAAFLLLYRLICAGLDRNTEAIREMTQALSDLRESLAGLACLRESPVLPRRNTRRESGAATTKERV
ncbi:MAG TPA: hypothetical protein VGN26_17080 [Armatimonadota bacterium]|jgi:hypothetical protein